MPLVLQFLTLAGIALSGAYASPCKPGQECSLEEAPSVVLLQSDIRVATKLDTKQADTATAEKKDSLPPGFVPPGQRYAKCWEAGTDAQSRDAACHAGLKCARKGFDNRDFGDCDDHCCSQEPLTIRKASDTIEALATVWPKASCARPSGWCAHPGSTYSFVDCDGDGVLDPMCRDSAASGFISSASSCQNTWPNGGCQAKEPVQKPVVKLFSSEPAEGSPEEEAKPAGDSSKEGQAKPTEDSQEAETPDASAKAGAEATEASQEEDAETAAKRQKEVDEEYAAFVAAHPFVADQPAASTKSGTDSASLAQSATVRSTRQGYPAGQSPPGERYSPCWEAGSDMHSRDAACSGDLKCARVGFDGRQFGDCDTHCCSVGDDTTPYSAGFVLGNEGSNDCPSEYENVLTNQECKESVQVLGLQDMTDKDDSEQAQVRPRGCWGSNEWAQVFYNPHRGDTRDIPREARPVCRTKLREPAKVIGVTGEGTEKEVVAKVIEQDIPARMLEKEVTAKESHDDVNTDKLEKKVEAKSTEATVEESKIRHTVNSCECQESWKFGGHPECSSYCCNPEDSAKGPWCFVVDPQCEGKHWGYCKPEEDSEKLPSGWGVAWDEKTHRKYYYYSQWTKPQVRDVSELTQVAVDISEKNSKQQGLPPGWDVAWDEKEQKNYYYKVQWTKPTAADADENLGEKKTATKHMA